MPNLKIDNLMGTIIESENIISKENDSSKIDKNVNINEIHKQNEININKKNKNVNEIHKQNEININENSKNANEIHKQNEININENNKNINNKNENIKINEIHKENEINIIDNNRNSNRTSKNDDIERSRTNTVVYNNEQRSTGNLEDIMFKGIQNEGFNFDNSSRNESFLQYSNQNSINYNAEEQKVKNNENKKEYQIEKNKGREIVMSPSTKMFQNISNNNANNFSINSDNKNVHLQSNKTLVENELSNQIRMSNSSSNKVELFPVHNKSVYSHVTKNSYQIAGIGLPNPKSKSELEEMRNNNNDYYSLFQEEYIQKKLKEEKDNCTEFDIYSDQIFLLVDKKHLNKRYIMLTPSNLYIIEPKEMKFTNVIKKENILCFQISNRNINILLFQIKDGNNILIETLRRMDLLLYLRDHYRNDKKLIKFKYEDKFKVKIKGKETTIAVKDKVFTNLSNFDGAQKIGYLLKYKGKFIGTIFKEKLFILTSIGLIMFDDTSSPPKKLYPIIGSNIDTIEGTKYGRENCFKITFLSGKTKIFATRKRRERDSWLKEFDRIIKEFQNKMKQLDTINKKFIEYSDKSLLPQNKEEKLKEEEKLILNN